MDEDKHVGSDLASKRDPERRKVLKLLAYATPAIVSLCLQRPAWAQATGSPPDPPIPPQVIYEHTRNKK